jgi:hypothetical protein
MKRKRERKKEKKKHYLAPDKLKGMFSSLAERAGQFISFWRAGEGINNQKRDVFELSLSRAKADPKNSILFGTRRWNNLGLSFCVGTGKTEEQAEFKKKRMKSKEQRMRRVHDSMRERMGV